MMDKKITKPHKQTILKTGMHDEKNKSYKMDLIPTILDKVHTELTQHEDTLRCLLEQNIYQKDKKEFLDTAIDNLGNAMFNIRHVLESPQP